MKKFLLSLAVVALFIFYSTFKQNNIALSVSLITPTVPPDKNTPTPSPTVARSRGKAPEVPANDQLTEIPPTVTPVENTVPTDTPAPSNGQYKDGVYIGDTIDVFYGNVQIQATISGGRITDVKFLQFPSDRQTSVEINSQAMPLLQSEAIQAQSAAVDGVSGASATSQGFIASLGSALSKAK
jgi:uncharacterized protein with FMN-binding domain